MAESQNLLKSPYHHLVTYHLPKEHIFHNIGSFKDTLESLKAEDFVDSPLPLDANLDFQDIMRFVSFRFWCACNRFPALRESLEVRFNKVVTAFSKNHEGVLTNTFRKRLNIQKCLLWHFSRGLIEDNQDIVERTLDDMAYSVYVEEDEDPRSTIITTKILTHLLKIFNSNAFKEAIQTFGVVIKRPLTEQELLELVKKLANMRIIAIEIGPPMLYGMVLPDGIALNLKNIRQLIKPDKDKSNAEKTEETLINIGLWASIHEIGHLLIRSAPFSNNLHFAKMTPPSEYSFSGQEYKNLEAGFLFSIIFLGTPDKMIWEDPYLISKLVNLDSDSTIPILSPHDLEKLPALEFKNITNSGALMMRTQKYRPITL